MCVVRWVGSPEAGGGCTRKGAVGHGQFVSVGRGSLSRSGGGQDLDDAIDLDGLALHHELGPINKNPISQSQPEKNPRLLRFCSPPSVLFHLEK